jgi:hypothetical protein
MKKNYVFEDGEWWYVGPKYRQRIDSHEQKNKDRMFVAGQYIPKTHPMHKPGRYESFEDAWSHRDLDATKQGYVYAVINPAWEDWVKIGMAVEAEDRVRAYQTSSPYRDYELLEAAYVQDKRKAEALAHKLCGRVCEDRNGEWFKMPLDVAQVIIRGLSVPESEEMLPESAVQLRIV